MKPFVKTILQGVSFAVLAALSIYLLPNYQSTFRYDYEVGKPWGHGLLRANFDFPIYKTDEQIRQETAKALENYAPYYNYQESSISSDIYVLSRTELDSLGDLGYTSIEIIRDKQKARVFLRNVYSPKTAFERLGYEVQPNLVYDAEKSQEEKAELLKAVSSTLGVIPNGAKIVDSGEMITPEIYQQLESLAKAYELNKSNKHTLISFISTSVCIVFLLLVFYLYLFTYRRKLLDDLRHTLFFVILMALIISVSFLLLHYVDNKDLVYIIPFVWCPIIARVFYDSRTAIFLHIITVSIVSIALSAPYMFLFMQILVGIVAVISLRDMTQRAQLAQTAAFVLVSYAILYTALHILVAGNADEIKWQYYLYFGLNAILIICAYGLIFLFERGFGLLSSITLVELNNVNSNLMLEFAEKAPGTFQHSLQVSNLATEAAKRIGAKVLLVRTGALYHDIGKMSNPECFIENQSDGYNPLNGMDNLSAAQVVLKHVLEGERIARKHHLPEVIIQFIRSHHGTSQTRYFYNTALNQAKQAGLPVSSVNAEEYTYPGPKPMTKEAAILMMADAIEARSRSLQEMTPQSISDMVDDMISIQMQDGQLAQTPLSFKDLEDVRAVFKQKLLEINHHRIVYPKVE